MNRWLRLTLLGVGAMNSPRFAPAGLLLRYGGHRVAFDGGPGAEPPPGRLAAWLVTDERSELRSELRRSATARDVSIRAGDLDLGEVRIRCRPVAHTSHPTYGYRIEADDLVVVWAPEFWEFPAWAAGADLMFADAAAWARPIRFRGGVGGHASVRAVAEQAVRHGVRRLVHAHIGRPGIRAIDAGLRPPAGEWGVEGRTYSLRLAGVGADRAGFSAPRSRSGR
ncbi:MBL fold metallo-hydrolase [Streptomyces sp. NPDC050619]|uniref:MBL fold metallo-hydrolase n=1 Tax=Streptomyces sp. NPDC050619 TaxID=3157214 RepID=UPI0034265BFC